MANKKDKVQNIAKDLGQPKTAVIEQPKTLRVALEVTGVAPLIQNNFSQKAIEQMLRKHMGLSVQKEAKKPREVIEAAKIKNVDGRICVPPQAFKSAMVSAASTLKSLKKTQLRVGLLVVGSSIPITFDTELPRMDMVRTSGMTRTPDVRFRPAFHGWKARMLIEFSELFSVQTVVDLLNRAGNVGVGEWRPEKNGTFGRFVVSRNITEAKEIADVEEQCAVPLVQPQIPDWALDADIDPELLKKAFDEGSRQIEEGGAALDLDD